MALQTNKLKFDPKRIHKARRKLQTMHVHMHKVEERGDEAEQEIYRRANLPTAEECLELLGLIREAEGLLYPSNMDLSMHQHHYHLLTDIDPEHEDEQYGEIAEKMQEFESKFCV